MTLARFAASRGYQARKDSDLPTARTYYTEAAVAYREAKDFLAYAHAIRHVADIHQEEGNFGAARPLYEEALELYRGSLDTKLLDLANTIRPYARLLEKGGSRDTARLLWEEAAQLYRSLRLEAGVAECVAHLARLAL